MASSSGTSSACFTLMQNSGSETDLLDERKRKRMQSNRESAMRSRKRKQEQLDVLMAQVGQLNQIISNLSSRNTEMQERGELYSYNSNPDTINENFDGLFSQMMKVPYLTQQQQQPIMASAEMFLY